MTTPVSPPTVELSPKQRQLILQLLQFEWHYTRHQRKYEAAGVVLDMYGPEHLEVPDLPTIAYQLMGVDEIAAEQGIDDEFYHPRESVIDAMFNLAARKEPPTAEDIANLVTIADKELHSAIRIIAS